MSLRHTKHLYHGKGEKLQQIYLKSVRLLLSTHYRKEIVMHIVCNAMKEEVQTNMHKCANSLN